MKNNFKRDLLKIFAQLSKSYNSYYEIRHSIDNLIDENEYPVILSNQFLPVEMRFPKTSSWVAHWAVEKSFLTSCDFINKAHFLGEKSSGDIIDFYLPVDFFEFFPKLVKSLGEPHELCESMLTASGRSLWIFQKDKVPFCLKIDTFNFDLPQKYNSRTNKLNHIIQTLKISTLLGSETNVFTENRGLSLEFKDEDLSSQKHYSYLIRDLDFEKCEILESDFIIPVQAILSQEFWNDRKLLSFFGLAQRNITDFLENDLAKSFADILKNSLNNSQIHFELHQQNLSIQVRDGFGIKLLYHDLLDTVFDPISYFLKWFDLLGFTPVLQIISNLHVTSTFNGHGMFQPTHFQKRPFTVVSLYRRYLRNFGDFHKIYNVFSGQDYFLSRKFEELILNNLSFSKADVGLDRLNPSDYDFFSKDLFWNIHNYQKCKQRKLLKQKFKLLQKEATTQDSLIEAKATLLQRISSELSFVSSGFPICFEFLEEEKMKHVYSIESDRIFFGLYEQEEFLVIFP